MNKKCCALCESTGRDINYSGVTVDYNGAVLCMEHLHLITKTYSCDHLTKFVKNKDIQNLIHNTSIEHYLSLVDSLEMHFDETKQQRLNRLIKKINKKSHINPKQKNKKFDLGSIGELIPYLDTKIIGQQEAKESLVLAFKNHLIRLKNPNLEIPKSNVLVIGPTGSGKTLIVRTICQSLDLPFIEADMSQMTASGYQGASVSSVLKDLYAQCKGDLNKVSEAVIYLDEIDKISANGNEGGKDVAGLGVQEELLKMIEGTKYVIDVPNPNNPAVPAKATIDTTNILFICTGAFEDKKDVVELKTKLASKKGIGFTNEKETKEVTKLNKIQQRIENLSTYGLSSELLGRLPVVVTTSKLTSPQLAKIIKKIQLTGYENLFEAQGYNLKFSTGAINHIADLIQDMPTGARGINTVMDEILKQPQLYPDKYAKDNKISIGINSVKEMIG